MTPDAEPNATDGATATVETSATPDAGPEEGQAVTVRPVAFTPLEGGAGADAQAGPRPLDLILDVQGMQIMEPMKLEEAINNIAGVVTVGIFARRPADVLILGSADGPRTITV